MATWDSWDPCRQERLAPLTVTVDGEERDAAWKEGVGIYVDGFGFGKGEVVEIEETPHRVVEMRRMMLENQAVTLIILGT